MRNVWFHTASVGEFNTAKPILKELKKDFYITLTYFSPRAKEYLQKNSEYYHSLGRIPLDLPFTVKRFEERIKPEVILIVERELWPSLLLFTKRKKILINAYAKGGLYEKFITRRLDLILTRTKEDKERFERYGCKDVRVCGNLKFVFEERESKKLDLNTKGYKLIVAGSTHEGEEELILTVFRRIKKAFPEVKLIIAPRHVSRAERIISLAQGFKACLRSSRAFDWDVLVVDTLGELFDIYSFADVAIVGGTFVPIGGHNLLEPVYHGKPVVFGKNVKKVKDMADYILKNQAGYMAKEQEELFAIILELLTGGKSHNVLDLKGGSESIKLCYMKSIREMLQS
ncbi:MAG: 3-deoxy-D-manno-octulosonic acid transferase [Aquificaceae bacterium]